MGGRLGSGKHRGGTFGGSGQCLTFTGRLGEGTGAIEGRELITVTGNGEEAGDGEDRGEIDGDGEIVGSAATKGGNGEMREWGAG